MSQLRELSPLEQMIQQQVVDRGIQDEQLLAAFRKVPRDRFFPAGSKDAVFADRAAPIGHGQTISQPYMVALMTHRLELKPEHRVLEIGTGSGYHTAIVAQLAGEVYTVERVKPLLDGAWERLMELGVRNVHFKHADGTIGWKEEAPFDRIIVTAGAPELPRKLLEQLKDGGIAVLPIGPADEQMLVVVKKKGEELEQTEVVPCRFVKLIGQEGWREEKGTQG
ncbi:MAG TPA: protein-L-isoaspartate(D-aspartate) O-methyltransferase [Tepidisphaeraceae bacterium]|nr:protein-L-isoaspartate(D-aspartate) O-methyltransferase [Tepidisphaeraceae bacterium]